MGPNYTRNKLAIGRTIIIVIVVIVVIIAAAGGAVLYSLSVTHSTTASTGSSNSSSASASTNSSSGTLVITTPLDIATGLDPQTNFDYGGQGGEMIVYETLVTYQYGTSNVVPDLATSWTVSSNLLNYTFELRQGVTFHDGTQFNASAVQFSYNRLLALNTGPAFLFTGLLSKVVILNNSAVTFVLTHPYSSFLALLATPIANGIVGPSSCIAHEVNVSSSNPNGDWCHGWLTSVHEDGTGAYTLQSWTQGQQAVFVQYPRYWKGWSGNHFTKVILQYVPETSTARLELTGGQSQFDYNVAISDVASLNQTSGFVVKAYTSFNLMGFELNAQRYPLTSTTVRQALSYAYNYSGGIQAAYLGLAVQPKGPFPIGLPYQDPNVFQYSFNSAKAVQLLEQAGWSNSSGTWKNGTGASFPTLNIVWQSAVPSTEPGCVELQANLARIGIPSTVVEMSRAEFFAAIANASSSPYVVSTILAPVVADPDDQYQLYFAGGALPPNGYNLAWWVNSTADSLAAQAVATSNQTQRTGLYDQLQSLIVNAAPAIFAWQAPYIIAFSTKLSGFQFTPAYAYINYDNLWGLSMSS